ncbi:MAG: hypothetical protein MJZ49_05695 [Bacteroidales bacterium]|nr:hypothetical protein [Bacteroidales bacterium]
MKKACRKRNLGRCEERVVMLALYFQLPFGWLNRGTQYHFRCRFFARLQRIVIP